MNSQEFQVFFDKLAFPTTAEGTFTDPGTPQYPAPKHDPAGVRAGAMGMVIDGRGAQKDGDPSGTRNPSKAVHQTMKRHGATEVPNSADKRGGSAKNKGPDVPDDLKTLSTTGPAPCGSATSMKMSSLMQVLATVLIKEAQSWKGVSPKLRSLLAKFAVAMPPMPAPVVKPNTSPTAPRMGGPAASPGFNAVGAGLGSEGIKITSPGPQGPSSQH